MSETAAVELLSLSALASMALLFASAIVRGVNQGNAVSWDGGLAPVRTGTRPTRR